MTLIERLKRANARAAPEESVSLRVVVAVAVLAAATAVVRQDIGSTAVDVATLVVLPAAFVFSHLARHRSGFWLKIGLAIGLLVAFGHFLSSLGGVELGTLADVQAPLAELFLWVQILHSLDVPARRDLMFSLASSVILVAIAGVLSVSAVLAWHVAVWGPAFVAGLVLAHRRELEELPALGQAVDTTPRSMLRPVAAVVAAVAVVGAAGLLVIPAGSARAFAFPARLPRLVDVPGGGGGISNPSLGAADPARPGRASSKGRASFGYFGFSDRLDTSLRGRPDNTLVMRVRAARPDFWRGQTFDRWDGRQWKLSDTRERAIGGDAPIDIPTPSDRAPVFSDSDLVQTFYVERPGPNIIFAAPHPQQLYFADNRVFVLSDGTMRSGVELERGAVYTVISGRATVTADALRFSAVRSRYDTPQPVLDRYTQLPDTLPARVRELAARVTAGETNVYDKVRALERWMAANTEYSLDVPPLPSGADAVDRFLFVDRIGFCEQIGSSLVVMLRSLGIPARLAVGYAPGERNPFTGMYEVRASDAHAWAEVWFPGVGWQGFDPTASVPLSGDHVGSATGAGLFSYLRARIPSPPAWTLALAPLLIVGSAAPSLVRRRRRTPPSWVATYVAQLERAGRQRGRPRKPNETPAGYALALGHSVLPDRRFERVAATLDVEAYSGAAAPVEERDAAERVLAEVSALWPA